MAAEMMMETNERDCQLCCEEGGLSLRDLIAAENLLERPPTIPGNIWRDREWFMMCLVCFINLLRNGPPEVTEEQDDIDLEIEMDDWEDWSDYDFLDVDFDPLSDTQEDVFWGQWREQRLTDYLAELNQMIGEEAPYNIEDNDVFKAEFWENQEFWSDVRDQWEDEISNEIEELRASHPPTEDLPNLTEFLRDLQNPPR